MQPMVDANLWSRLVGGELLVVREGVTPVNVLKKGLQALDNLRLIGVVVNEASDFDLVGYEGKNCGAAEHGKTDPEQMGKRESIS
jgi:Mrp family chromosome partitioning ATPase